MSGINTHDPLTRITSKGKMQAMKIVHRTVLKSNKALRFFTMSNGVRVAFFRLTRNPMIDGLVKGDIVHVDPDAKLVNGCIAVVKNSNCISCNRWYRKGETVTLKNDVVGEPPINIPYAKVTWAYRAVAYLRKA